MYTQSVTESDSPPARASVGAREWIASIGLAAVALLAWGLRHGYEGITHDARLYSFQAMAHFKPELLGNDLYLRLGSQDKFSIFSSVFGWLIGVMGGFEHAAALITFVSQAAFLVACWFLARRLMSRELAWLSILLLLTVPSVFAAYSVWSFLENFATPRLPCEALVLVALTAMLDKRHLLACITLAIAVTIHPLMAFVGIVMALYIRFMPLPKLILRGLLVLTLVGLVIAAYVIPADSPLRMDDEWMSLFRGLQEFLFVFRWRAVDWARTAVHFTTLIFGLVIFLRGSPQYLLCMGSLVIGAAGVLLATIGGDVLNYAIILQAQPWRWLWIGATLSVLLAPAIAARCWQLGPMGRVAVVLLLISWLSIHEPYTIIVAPIAILVATVAARGQVLSERAQNLIFAGVILLCALIGIRSIANALMDEHVFPSATNVPYIVNKIRMYSHDGLLPTLAVVGLWWLFVSPRAKAVRAPLAALCFAAFVTLAPAFAGEFRAARYSKQDFDLFESWRKHIPPGEEVLWVGGGQEAWALLERPRYVAQDQSASILFSRAAAFELKRRLLPLTEISNMGSFIFMEENKPISRTVKPTLEDLCKAAPVRFIISWDELAPHPLEKAPEGVSNFYRAANLYECAR